MKVLFITQQISTGDKVRKGGEVVSRDNYNVLVNVYGSNNVEIISIPEEKRLYKKYLHYMMLRNMYSEHIEQEIVQRINDIEWNLLFFDGSWFGRISKMVSKKGKIVAFFHNIERQYSLQRLKKNPLTIFKYFSVACNERCLMEETDYIIALNLRDELLIKKYYQKETDLILPISLQDSFETNNDREDISGNERLLLFVGSYFNPNKEGAIWFIKNVMPHVNYKLLIAGKGMEKLKKYENDKIAVLGTVDSLGELYQKVDIIVIPIFSGGGMKVKTAEAMMYGKRILATKEALTGYDIHGINAVTECNTKGEFIFMLNNTENNVKKFYPEVRKKFLEKYEQSVKINRLAAFLSMIVN